MSASSAGKFQDHYALFGIDPKAGSDVIQAAYTKLAQKYHPNNTETGDAEKFESINLAYEVLCDPELRKSFDKLKGVDQDGDPKFSGAEFFEAMGRGSGLRSALLCLLYDRRRGHPFKPSVSMRHIENMLAATPEELSFALWYLKQRNLAINDDKSSLQITVDGMDRLEKDQPSPELVMPFFKPHALAAKDPEAVPPAKVEMPVATPGPTIAERSAPIEEFAGRGMGTRLGGLLKATGSVRG